jgi:hypothetical protein
MVFRDCLVMMSHVNEFEIPEHQRCFVSTLLCDPGENGEQLMFVALP